jgi:hypothetical protein
LLVVSEFREKAEEKMAGKDERMCQWENEFAIRIQ